MTADLGQMLGSALFDTGMKHQDLSVESSYAVSSSVATNADATEAGL